MGHSPILTPREALILELVSAGCSNREAAALLHVSVKDVEYHVGNLLRKLGARNRAAAVSRAYAVGYLKVGCWPPRAKRTPAGDDDA